MGEETEGETKKITDCIVSLAQADFAVAIQ